jgi:hypothetical protein
MLTVLGTLAEIYIDNLRQETRKGHLQRARQGYWVGNIPFGYCNGLCSHCTDPNGPGYCPDVGQQDKGNGKGLVPHPIESQVVRMVFDWYATDNESTRSISTRLNDLQIPLPDGSSVPARQKGHLGRTAPGAFGCDLIRDMLRRPTYIGKIRYQGLDENGKHRKRKPPIETFQGAHVPIVDANLFAEVQELINLRGKNPFINASKKRTRIFPLTGIFHCGYCGGTMRGTSKTHPHYDYYSDANQADHKCECPQKLVRAENIEQQVVKWLRYVVENAVTSEEYNAAQIVT